LTIPKALTVKLLSKADWPTLLLPFTLDHKEQSQTVISLQQY